MLVKGRRTMARHLIRALGGIALAGASLALAACSSSGSPGAAGSAKPDSVPVKNGTVTVREGDKVICVMKVVNGKGTCTVPASTVGGGTKTIVGEYTGKQYGRAQSPPLYLSVIKAASSVALSVSHPTVTFGDEQVARVTVKVTGHSAVPTGSVLVRSGAATVCTITLSHGTGSCALGVRQLPAGSRLLSASYLGDSLHYPGSAEEKITVAGFFRFGRIFLSGRVKVFETRKIFEMGGRSGAQQATSPCSFTQNSRFALSATT
jgi:hypothetical protein